MSNTSEKRTSPETAGDELVRMYPSNQLKAQLRDPKDTLSAFTVLKETFFTEKK